MNGNKLRPENAAYIIGMIAQLLIDSLCDTGDANFSLVISLCTTYVINFLLLLQSQISHGGKDAESAENAGQRVHKGDDQSVTEDRPVEAVVRAEGHQASKGYSNRVENLCCRINPNLSEMNRRKL